MIRALLSHAFGPLCAVASSIFPNAAGILVALAVAWSDGPVSHLYSRWSGSCEVTARLGLRQATKKTTMKFWQVTVGVRVGGQRQDHGLGQGWGSGPGLGPQRPSGGWGK